MEEIKIMDKLFEESMKQVPQKDWDAEMVQKIYTTLRNQLDTAMEAKIKQLEDIDKMDEITLLKSENERLKQQIKDLEKDKDKYRNFKESFAKFKENMKENAIKGIEICKEYTSKTMNTVKEFSEQVKQVTKQIDNKYLDVKFAPTVLLSNKLSEIGIKFNDALIKNNDKTLEKNAMLKESLSKVHEQLNQRTSLIKSGFQNLGRAFLGKDAIEKEQTHLFDSAVQVLSKAIDKGSDILQKENTHFEEQKRSMAQNQAITKDAIEHGAHEYARSIEYIRDTRTNASYSPRINSHIDPNILILKDKFYDLNYEKKQQALDKILSSHEKWLNGERGGERAVLNEVNLEYLDLSGRDLRGASLIGADLRYAHLEDTNLIGANLAYAKTEEHTLDDAILTEEDIDIEQEMEFDDVLAQANEEARSMGTNNFEFDNDKSIDLEER